MCIISQVQDQYFFIHEAVAEAIECGVTEVKVDVFPRYLEQLEQLVGVDSDTTGIELEFRVSELSTVFILIVNCFLFAVGIASCNRQD